MIREAAARKRAEVVGRKAEHLAAWFLRLKGFSIMAQRYKAPVGEIDLVAKRRHLLIFVEVKARKTIDAALFAVSTHNSRRISAAAAAYLARHPHLAQCDMRYDIIAVAGWRLRHVTDAWRD